VERRLEKISAKHCGFAAHVASGDDLHGSIC
jgi:hypothetical protein